MVGKLVLTLVVALLLMGCSPTPKAVEKIVEQTRVVLHTVEVPQTVVVQETVLVLQTVVVQETVQVVITVTPIPATPTPKMTATSTKNLS